MQKLSSGIFKFWLVLISCLLCNVGIAQEKDWENPNFKQKMFEARDSVQFDSLLIIPDKIRVLSNNKILNPELYKIDLEKSKIYFNSEIHGSEIQIQYYTFPDLKRVSFSKDTALIIEPTAPQKLYSLENDKPKNKELFSGLNSRGALIRGISFGNNQGAAVQSSLDLQLNGKLSDDVSINAVISDNNVPIESDGYTQQLQEFDKVFIEIYNKNSSIRAGHLDLQQSEDFFGNFSEKVTGLQVSTNVNGEKYKTNISAAGSVSRGEFVQFKFNGQEGNQGPYRLSGNNNELFVVILSGSERVFLDGIQLKRGQDQDYTINYNTGELNFTTNRLITANSRIVVEYLYSNRNYSRFLFYGGVETKSERLKIGAHFYSNGDSKGNPINQSLSENDLNILENAGDNQSLMVAPTAETADFDADRIQYRQIQINNETVFEFTTDPNETVFNVNFSFVGQGNGNYVQTNLDVNGRIFTYVPPINGIPQGDYEPIVQLVAPERLQMFTINSNYQLKNNGEVGVDLGLSNNDLNLFSSIDNDDNLGIAARVYTNKSFKSKNWLIKPQLEYSFIQDQFNAIQRIRYQEFTRDFNLVNEIDSVNQHYLQFNLNSEYKNAIKFNYELDVLDNQNLYTGIKNTINSNYKTDKNLANATASFLNTDGNELNSSFKELSVMAQRKIKKNFWVGAQYELEDNQIKNALDDNFSEQSFRWNQLDLRTGIGDSTKRYVSLDLYTRKDDSVRLGTLQNLSKAQGVILNSRILNKVKHKIELNSHFRMVDYTSNELSNEDFITGNFRWYKSFLDNGLDLDLFYGLESGVEQQREFEYVEVNDGLGLYKWTDYNNDGIQQIDEFELAEFQDEASYIRVFTNSINAIRTNKNQLTFSAKVKPKNLLSKESEFLDRFLLQFSLQSNNSALKENKTLEWNPFISDDELLSKTRNYRLNFFYNRGRKYKWSGTYNYTNQQNQTFIFTGTELRDSQSHLAQIKYKPKEGWLLFLDLEQKNDESNSTTFAARRYNLDSYRVQPKMTYKVGESLTSSFNYQYQNKKNSLGIEQLNQSELNAELQWNNKNKRSLFASFSYINNRFTGNENTVVGNQMMEGLRAGNNYVWQLLFQQQITSYLNINLTYNGRKTELNDTIHSGSVQMQIRF